MTNFLIGFILIILTLFNVSLVHAVENAFVSVVNPIRGADFWDKKDQLPETAVKGQIEVLKKYDLNTTWLLRFDALSNKKIVDDLNNASGEKGLFLEVTPSWALGAAVNYQQGASWHDAKSAFLTGYERGDREKLIDASFEKFKQTFGYYPKSVGAWWIDAYSLGYMHKIYNLTSSMIVSDQYTTDNYQIWGQYFSTPYYPSVNNALHPAQSPDHKLPVVVMQWAPRDPLNSYGNGVFESTFSLQPNDYLDYHNLGIKYFSKLLDLYTNQKFNKFSHLVVGLENSYSWDKYSKEYENQIKLLADKRTIHQLSVVTMGDFAVWYKKNFPDLSPAQIIIADDPLGDFKKVVWFMNPFYRAGWFFTAEGSVFRDIRQYIDGEEELCFQKSCDSVNFATSATRVLDDVSFGHKWVIDQGKIKGFSVIKEDEKYVIGYENEAGKKRVIEFLPRDIAIDGKINSIDSAILSATKADLQQKNHPQFAGVGFNFTFASVVLKTIKFILFLVLAIFLPGWILIVKAVDKSAVFLQKIFLSVTVGLTVLTVLFYVFSLLNIRPMILGYLLIANFLFLKHFWKHLRDFAIPKGLDLSGIIIFMLIILGTVFQIIPTFRSGLSFQYGIGYWGPNTHDGIWHIALINQLIKSVPPQNPIFSGEVLKNYHYFYDLLLAATSFLTSIPIMDLVFRFYPVVFSLSLGIGTYYLVMNLFSDKLGKLKAKLAAVFSLYFVYFAGSFGWIVEFLRERHLGGESAFWANQSISFNLNPPFAISLIIVIAIFLLLPQLVKNNKFLFIILIVLCGSLISFKAYAGILILLTLLFVGILKRSLLHIFVFAGSFTVSAILFISNFSLGQKLLVFSPFWFIHSMIDSPDRVGWFRLSLTRSVGLSSGNWIKFLGAETISLFIFIAGNLGIRVLALFSLLRIKVIFKETKYLFLFIFSGLSLVIPILFIQAGNPWNTIQFIYYFLYVSALICGMVVLQIIKFNRVVTVPLVLMILIITPINSWATANGYLSQKPHAFISSKEIGSLQFLKSQPDGVVLTYPYDNNLKKKLAEPWPLFVYDSTAYVSAMSGKEVFLEDEPQNQILLTDYGKRLVASKDFFSKPSIEGAKFLEDNHIKYIYLPKIFNVRMDETLIGIKNIFENDHVIIYKFKD